MCRQLNRLIGKSINCQLVYDVDMFREKSKPGIVPVVVPHMARTSSTTYHKPYQKFCITYTCWCDIVATGVWTNKCMAPMSSTVIMLLLFKPTSAPPTLIFYTTHIAITSNTTATETVFQKDKFPLQSLQVVKSKNMLHTCHL